MAFGINNDNNIPATTATTTAKAKAFKQYLKRWIGWRPKRPQQNSPSIQHNNNYLMISPGSQTSIENSTPIPNDDQSTIAESTQSSNDFLQQQAQQKPYDEALARLSNYTDDTAHLDYTLESGSHSSNKIIVSANRLRPTLIDTNIARTKLMNSSTYNRLTGPLTTSAFSDMTNSSETSPISTTSIQQALPLSPSWDPELQLGRDASLIDSDLSTLSNSLSNIGSTTFAPLNARCHDDDNKQLASSKWLSDDSDSENDDNSIGALHFQGNDSSTALHYDNDDDNDDTLARDTSLMMMRESNGAWSTIQQDTNETITTTAPLTSAPTFFTSSASSPSSSVADQCPATQPLECEYYDAPSLEQAGKMNDPGSITSFFTTNSSFTQQDMEDGMEIAHSSIPLTSSSSLDTDTMLLVTHAVDFLKSREDSSWDDDDSNNNNGSKDYTWLYTQRRADDVSPIPKTTSSRKALNLDITPSPSTSTASTLVTSGGRKIASLFQDKNINDGGMTGRKETPDEEIHRIVSTHVLF